MYPLLYSFQSFYDYFDNRDNELKELKKENDTLKYKLNDVLVAKNDIYKKYQNLIIENKKNNYLLNKIIPTLLPGYYNLILLLSINLVFQILIILLIYIL